MKTANDTIRDQLKETRAQLETKRGERQTALQEREAAKQAFADSGKSLSDVNSPEFKAAEEATGKLGAIDDEIADLQKAENAALTMLGESAPEPSGGAGNGPGGREADRGMWDGHQLLAREGGEYQRARAQAVAPWHGQNQFGSITLGEVASRDQAAQFFAAPIGSADLSAGVQAVDRRGIVQPLLKPLTLLDLIPTGTTDSNSIEYVQVVNVPSGAVEVAEGGLKPELGLGTQDAVAPVRTIAGWIKLMRQALDDIAALGTLINTLLPYEVRRRIESQILVGDGNGQNLRGILNTTGIGSPAFVAGDNPADAILRAMTTVILSDGDPNFVAANPLLWQDILLLRETGAGATRSGAYIFGTPASMAAPTIWGLTLTANRVVPQASPLVGDSNGATLLVREGVNTRVSDSDQDDFVRNRVTVLAEARVALPIWRPASFAVGDLS